jgi:hypothetical protein
LFFVREVREVIIEGTGVRGRASEGTHVCRIHPQRDGGNLSHSSENISFLEESWPVSGSIISPPCNTSEGTKLRRLYSAIKKFCNIVFFAPRLVDLCQSDACETSRGNRDHSRALCRRTFCHQTFARLS